MRARIGRDPEYKDRPPEDKDEITAGIWHGYPEETKRRLAKREGKTMKSAVLKGAIFAILKACRDFGGSTTHNLDWERGAREGERKAEDRMRGIKVQRDREAQFQKKQQIAYASDPDNPAQQSMRDSRQQGLRWRAGQGKEQHQGVGKVPVGPDPDKHKPLKVITTNPVEKRAGGRGQMANDMQMLRDHAQDLKVIDLTTPDAEAQIAKEKREHPNFTEEQIQQIVSDHMKRMKNLQPSPHSGMFIPITVKSVGDLDKGGEVFVEGTVSMPIKDLQGDLLELPALIQAKNAMVTPPNDLVWLDHFSPYAKPEAGREPPIGKFVKSAILHNKEQPALWGKMLVNKAHPTFKETLYELQNGFRNAFSMEFIPIREVVKQVGGKIVNAISEIKYFATSLVRAPANEGATVSKVYVKAFANSSQFCPIRVKGLGWTGQTVMEKNVKMSARMLRKEAEPEGEPEPEEEPEQEEELEEEPDESAQPLKRRDFDRQTGSTAPERANTALGEWGDPALDKARATLKDFDERIQTLEGMMSTIAKNTAIIGKSLIAAGIIKGKGIDEDTLETLGEEEGPGLDGEQQQGEVKWGKMGKPKPQRVITTFPGPDLPGEEVEDQAVDVKSLGRFIVKAVNAAVDRAVDRKTVVRKGFNEQAGPIPENIKRAQLVKEDDGSIESQLAVIDAFK